MILMTKVLEIGAAENPQRGYRGKKGEKIIRLDIKKMPHINVVHNLEKFPYPFKNNEFDVIYASHVLEHLDDTLKVLKELHRISKPNAKIVIIVPHFSGYTAWSNPDHKKAFAADAFRRLPPDFRIEKIEMHYSFMGDGRPLSVRVVDRFFSGLANSNQWACERFWCYLVGGFTEIYCELRVVK